MEQLKTLTNRNGRKDVNIWQSDVNILRIVFESLDDDEYRQEFFVSSIHKDKILSYKSISALVKYAKANQIQHDAVTSCPASASNPAKLLEQGEGILFCDTETTGLKADDEIIEIALVDINENIVFQSYIKPIKPISKQATAIHGISNAMVANAPTFEQVLNVISKRIKYRDLSAQSLNDAIYFYNKDFDTRLICQTAKKAFDYSKNLTFEQIMSLDKTPGRPSINCLMQIYARYWGDWSDYHQSYRWQTLNNACIAEGIRIDDVPNHRASGDAIKTARLYKALVKQGVV